MSLFSHHMAGCLLDRPCIYNGYYLAIKRMNYCHLWQHNAKWNKSERDNTIWLDLNVESKKTKLANETETNSQTMRTNWWTPDGRGVGKLGKKVKGLISTNRQLWKRSQGCEAQHGAHRQQHCNNYAGCQSYHDPLCSESGLEERSDWQVLPQDQP